jgi:hypothetical protein
VRVKFSLSVQTGPGANPASYKMGTESLSRSYLRGAKVKERAELYVYSSFGLSWPVEEIMLPLQRHQCENRIEK